MMNEAMMMGLLLALGNGLVCLVLPFAIARSVRWFSSRSRQAATSSMLDLPTTIDGVLDEMLEGTMDLTLEPASVTK